jgi:EAL domain-containing protein (putative c-di-GMP-specific phosphodiesterase class I)
MKPDHLSPRSPCPAAPVPCPVPAQWPSTASAITGNAGTLNAALRIALLEQQFFLYYQPVFDHQRRMTGAEALIRWMHPQRGLVGPCEFIPQAEKSNMIVDIGYWVLNAACRQLAAWQRDPVASTYTVAVNISARQVRQPDFVARVLAILAETGASPFLLKLELTESMLVGNVDDIVDKMNALHTHGIGFALDDFGTGFSSLCYLERLPVTHIKIDRSFVRNMFVTPRAAKIVQALIALAYTLDLDVVAEGVETEAQWAALIAFGARRFQGYLFAEPVRVGELRRWMV